MQITLHLPECVHACVMVVGGRVADKRGDCHPGALDLIEHAAMLIENPLFIRADRSGQLRDPLSENTQINDLELCRSSEWWERQDERRVSAARRLISLAAQFSPQEIDLPIWYWSGSWAEGAGPRCSVSDFLGTAPPDRGQVGWSKINHSLFPLSPGLGEVTSRGAAHTSRHTRTHTHWPLIFLSLYLIHLSLPP